MEPPMHEKKQKAKTVTAGAPTSSESSEKEDGASLEANTKLPQTPSGAQDGANSTFRRGFATHQFERAQATGKIRFHGVVFRKFRSKRYQSGRR